MSKFKVGDTVNYTGNEWPSIVNPCVIKEEPTRCVSIYLCRSSNFSSINNDEWFLQEKELELVLPKGAKMGCDVTNTHDEHSICSECDVITGGCTCQEVPCKAGTPEEIVTNDKGGKNSNIGVRFDLIPPLAIKELAKVYKGGAKKYEAWNWLKVTPSDHINHALNHIYQFLDKSSGTTTSTSNEQGKVEDLSHAFCRLSMALELFLKERTLQCQDSTTKKA